MVIKLNVFVQCFTPFSLSVFYMFVNYLSKNQNMNVKDNISLKEIK